MNDDRLDTLAKAIYYTKNIIPLSTFYYDINVIDTDAIAKNLLYRGADSLLHDVAGRTGNPLRSRLYQLLLLCQQIHCRMAQGISNSNFIVTNISYIDIITIIKN